MIGAYCYFNLIGDNKKFHLVADLTLESNAIPRKGDRLIVGQVVLPFVSDTLFAFNSDGEFKWVHVNLEDFITDEFELILEACKASGFNVQDMYSRPDDESDWTILYSWPDACA